MTSEPLFVKSLVYDEKGYFPVVVNCSGIDNDYYVTEREIPSVIPLNDIRIDGETSDVILAVSDTGMAKLNFTVTTGWPIMVKATINGEPLDERFISVNMTSNTGQFFISNIGKNVLNITFYNHLSSEVKSVNVTLVEPVKYLYIIHPKGALINSPVLLTGSSQGSNVEYMFCVDEPIALEGRDNCSMVGNPPYLNYTFRTAGSAMVTLIAKNAVSEEKKESVMQIVFPVEGFTLTCPKTASTTDTVRFELRAPDSSHFPMGELMLLYIVNGQTLQDPQFLNIEPGGSHIVNTTLSTPGITEVDAIIGTEYSSQELHETVRVGDPINGFMSTSGQLWRSDQPLIVNISDIAGWGFSYDLLFGDGHSIVSPPQQFNKTFEDTLVFNHTYSEDKTFMIVFEARNLVHEQTLRDEVTIIHPVTSVDILYSPIISVPDGWATFEMIPTKPAPTKASCSIDYGDDTMPVLNIDWRTGFPASHNYKSTGQYEVNISCKNALSANSTSLLVTVHDRDIDIQGLRLTIPDFSLVNTLIDLEISIETGSQVTYLLSIGDDFVKEIVDKLQVTQWTFTHTFTKTGQTTVTVTATNDVSQARASAATFVVNPVRDFKLKINSTVVSSLGDVELIVRSPGSELFPMGPITVQLFKDSEVLSSQVMQSLEPEFDIEMTFSRWAADSYSIKAVVASPVDSMELAGTLITENPVPFFTFTADDVVTIPDGAVHYLMETQFDEPMPTGAMCTLWYGDGEKLTMSWDYVIALNHTFHESGVYNTSMLCQNRVSERRQVRYLDLCEFNAEGFRFDYPKIVPFNSSAQSVTVRFKYNICGLKILTSDADIAWIFEPDSDVRKEEAIDWEIEHTFKERRTYDVRVFIKSRQTNTETTVTLPIRIGVLTLKSSRYIGRVKEDVFNLTVSGAFGDKVHYLVDFGEGTNVSLHKMDVQEKDSVAFSKVYEGSGVYRPRVLAWSRGFVEEVVNQGTFVVQEMVKTFDIDLDQETWNLPIFISFTIHLRKGVSPEYVACILEPGDGSEQIITFNPDVQRHYSLRFVHSYMNYGPFDISANCSNMVSYYVNGGRIRLRTSSGAGDHHFLTPLLLLVALVSAF